MAVWADNLSPQLLDIYLQVIFYCQPALFIYGGRSPHCPEGAPIAEGGANPEWPEATS